MSQTTMNERSKVTVVCESVAMIPDQVAKQLGIPIVPFTVNVNGKSYLDGINLQPAELYRRMRVEDILPTTTAASLGSYRDTFRASIQAGASSILCVALSSRLSAGYSTACEAAKLVQAEFPDCTIAVMDTLHVTSSQGFVAIAAAKAAAEGKSLAEVRQVAEEACTHVGFFITLETLDYLARGGRIGKASYMLGSLIKIKPILTLEKGEIAPVDRVRGDNHALNMIVDHVARKADGRSALHIAVMDADAPEQAMLLKELVQEKLQPVEILTRDFTPVLGVHVGPGMVGLAYYYE